MQSHVHTDIEKNSAIVLLVNNVVLEYLVVQGLWRFHSRRHGVGVAQNGPIEISDNREDERDRRG